MYYSISGLLELCSFLVSGVAIILLCFYVASVFLFYPPRLFSFGTFLFSFNFPLSPSIINSFFFLMNHRRRATAASSSKSAPMEATSTSATPRYFLGTCWLGRTIPTLTTEEGEKRVSRLPHDTRSQVKPSQVTLFRATERSGSSLLV